MSSPKIIVALDMNNKNELASIINSLDPQFCRLKVGKTLFTEQGPEIVQHIQRLGFEVFLDLKFHDIPQQVAGAVTQAAKLGVWMVNVHALGGKAMLKAAKQSVDQCEKTLGRRPLLIGVTLLTSLSETDLDEIGINGPMPQAVLRLANLCQQQGLDGVVSSAKEARMIKDNLGESFLCVTPGIRLPNDATGDQKRVMTPQAAVEGGSDYLVMGRSITDSASPRHTLQKIHEEIAGL